MAYLLPADKRAYQLAYDARPDVRERKHQQYLAARDKRIASAAARQKLKAEEVNAKNRRWRAANPEKAMASRQAWDLANPGRMQARSAARRARRIAATPSWADRAAIDALYAEASRLGLEVDHIVPLKHPCVCGLHVHWNLQLLARAENLRKSNSIDHLECVA
jgi:5-methylcytosine-specific restriction endonuclease McrA